MRSLATAAGWAQSPIPFMPDRWSSVLPTTIDLGGLPVGFLDLVALVWFLAAFAGYHMIAGLRPLERRSIVAAVQSHRIAWMANMAQRDNRMLDAMLLQALGHGNAFFASTSAIAIGGLAAIMGSGDKLQSVLERLPMVAKTDPGATEIKILLLIAIFIYAFFKFAWAFRLSHYIAIMIGATPLATEANSPECAAHAERTARLIGIAANHANSGIRSFYYAFAAMAWFFHPLLFMLATGWVLSILVRRDFFSRSFAVIAGKTR